MYSITDSMCAGTPEERGFFPHFHPVEDVRQALEEIHSGYDVMLPAGCDWPCQARQVLLGLGATPDWAEDVVSHAVEFRRIPA